jgi:hypothetical protein
VEGVKVTGLEGYVRIIGRKVAQIMVRKQGNKKSGGQAPVLKFMIDHRSIVWLSELPGRRPLEPYNKSIFSFAICVAVDRRLMRIGQKRESWVRTLWRNHR